MKDDDKRSLKLWREPAQSSKVSFHIRGVGVDETMRPGIVNRPLGSGDWLLICFHNQVKIKSTTGIQSYPPGSLIIWDKNDGHYYGSPDVVWCHSWLHFDGQIVSSLLNDSALPTNQVLSLHSSTILPDALQAIYRELTEQSNPDRIILQNIFHNLLRKLSREIVTDKSSRISPRLLKIKTLLERYPARRFQIAELAKEAAMSIPHFCAEFKSEIGISAIEYHIRIRLELATYLLYNMNLSITEIAEQLGYRNIFHFSKQFKNHYGVSPRNMRNSIIKAGRSAVTNDKQLPHFP